eukprot:1097853-Rhodomonas_salina.2
MVREEHIATAWPAHEDGDHVTFDPLTIADHGEPLASWDNNVILELYKEGELADVVIRARDFANGTRAAASDCTHYPFCAVFLPYLGLGTALTERETVLFRCELGF